MSKFKGVAYWGAQDLPEDWLAKASERLQPIAAHGGTVAGNSNEIAVEFSDGGLRVVIASGQTQGVVHESTAAGVLVTCLMALQKRPGGIQLSDDDNNLLPNIIRQTFPPFAADWQRVRAVAESLELVAGKEFTSRHGAILQRLI